MWTRPSSGAAGKADLKLRYTPIDTSRIKTYRLADRKSKVDADAGGKPFAPGGSFRDFLATLPGILAADSFRSVVKAVALAKKDGRPVILGIGGHVIKVGLAPVIIDLMEKGIIAALAMNGSCIVHDFEMAYQGRTSEDVDA